MAQTNDNSNSSLEGFDFNDNADWFNMGSTTKNDKKSTNTSKVIGNIKEDDDENEEASTKLDDKTDKGNVETPANEEGVETFFGQTVDEEETDDEPNEEAKDKDKDKGKDKDKDKKKKDEKPKSSNAAGTDAPEVDEDDEEEDDKNKGGTDDEPEEFDEKKIYSSLAKDMKDRNIFQNVEVKEDEELTEDTFFEKLDAEVEARVDETLEQMSEEMDEDGKRFLKFKASGGKTQDFLATYAKPVDLDSFDESDEKQIDAVLRMQLADEELDAEEINDRLAYWKDSGKLKAQAVKAVAKLKKQRDALVDTTIKANKKAQEDREKTAKQFVADFSEVLSETTEVGIVPITDKDKKELTPYITKPVVKVGKNRYIPQFQAELQKILKAETKEDKQLLAGIAKMVKEKLASKDVATKTTTKVTQKAKARIVETKRTAKTGSSGGSNKRALSDFF